MIVCASVSCASRVIVLSGRQGTAARVALLDEEGWRWSHDDEGPVCPRCADDVETVPLDSVIH